MFLNYKIKMVKHQESDSESRGETHAEEPLFRISVCMQQFHRDHRARAYVCVCARRRVRWLRRRLRALFALPPAFHLLCRGHLLPPDEPLALLDRDDLVQVVPAHGAIDEDIVDSVASVLTEERQRSRSRSPVQGDELSETKRQALLMLEQYCAADAPATRPRRRRVRRRRRAPPAACPASPASPAACPASPASPAACPASPASPAGPASPAVSPACPATPLECTPCVLRNELQPRAPRVVRPLCESPAASRTAPCTQIVT